MSFSIYEFSKYQIEFCKFNMIRENQVVRNIRLLFMYAMETILYGKTIAKSSEPNTK